MTELMDIICPKNGYVEEVFVKTGGVIDVGQPLFRLSAIEETASLKKLEIMKATMEKHRILFSDDMVEIKRNKLNKDLLAAESALVAAKEHLEIANERLNVGLGTVTGVCEAEVGPLSAKSRIQHAKDALDSFDLSIKTGKMQMEIFDIQNEMEIDYANSFIDLTIIKACASGILKHDILPRTSVSKGFKIAEIKL